MLVSRDRIISEVEVESIHFQVLNSMGQQVFFAAEKNDCCTRQCCGPLREFEMALTGEYRSNEFRLSFQK